MRYAFLLITAAAAALVASCSDAEEELPQDAAQGVATASPTTPPATPSPAVKGQLWRWVNVTVVIPEGLDVQVSPQDAPATLKPPSGGPAVLLVLEDPTAGTVSSVLVDAETGAILEQGVRAEDQSVIDQVLVTIAVSPLDPATAPWPYDAKVPNVTPDRIGDLLVVRPGPAAGIQIYSGISDSFAPTAGSLAYLRITNGRSTALVDVSTGERLERNESVIPADAAPFERLISSIQLCGRDVQC